MRKIQKKSKYISESIQSALDYVDETIEMEIQDDGPLVDTLQQVKKDIQENNYSSEWLENLHDQLLSDTQTLEGYTDLDFADGFTAELAEMLNLDINEGTLKSRNRIHERNYRNDIEQLLKLSGQIQRNSGISDYNSKADMAKTLKNLNEKATSKDQQQAAGIALSAKRGDTPVSELKGAAKEMYDGMSEKELEDFAGTKHSEIKEGKMKNQTRTAQESIRETMNRLAQINEETGYNSDELIRALHTVADEEDDLAVLHKLADRINQSHPDSVARSDIENILLEPGLRDIDREMVDYALQAAGFMESNNKESRKKIGEWANSTNQNYDDRGDHREQPPGETVDLSLRRYLNADPHAVKLEEDISEDQMLREYKKYKGDK